jgi:hypothetical protein
MDWLETLAVAVATGSIVVIVGEIALRQPSAFIELSEDSERFARGATAPSRRRPLRYATVAGGLAAAALAVVVAQLR